MTQNKYLLTFRVKKKNSFTQYSTEAPNLLPFLIFCLNKLTMVDLDL